MYGTSAVVPAVAAVQFAAAGARPPVVLIRWMNVVSAKSSPPRGPLAVDTADSFSQSIAVGSTLTPDTRAPTTLLPSLACHVGPAKWLPISLRPLRS